MKSDDFKQAPPAVRSLSEPVGSIADLLEVEIAAARSLGMEKLLREAENLRNHFGYMLKYLVRNDIPDLATTTGGIVRQAKRLRLKILREYNIVNSPRSYYASVRFRRLRPEENLESLVSDYLSELNRRSNDPMAMMSNTANATLESLSSDIFEHIRTSFNFDEHANLIESLISDNALPEADRVLWVSAVGLALFELYDDSRTTLLLNALRNGSIGVRVAAAVWLAISFPASVRNHIDQGSFRIDEILANPGRHIFAQAVFEIARLSAMSRLSEAERERIVPSMTAMLRNLNLPKDSESARDFMKDPGKLASSPEAYDWMHRFNEAVREGYDVQESNLGKLRHWNFFGKLSNWLLPYDPNHSALAGIADEEGAPLADMLTKMGSLIDTDKYALILSLTNIPASMREAAMQGTMDQLGDNSDELREALDEEAREGAKMRTRVNNYAKQVWRVFATHPKRDEFMPSDRFLNYPETIVRVRELFDDDMLRRFADMFLKLNDATRALMSIELLTEPTDADDRKQARAALLSVPVDSALYHDYMESHPDDIETALLGVEHGMTDHSTLLALQAHEDVDSENVPFLKAFVKILMANGRYDQAVDHLMALEYLDVDNAEAYRKQRARALVLNSQWDEAVEALEGTVPDDAPEIAVHVFALWMGHRRPQALELLEHHKSNPQLDAELKRIEESFIFEENADTIAMFRYLMDSWQYILNDINPLNI